MWVGGGVGMCACTHAFIVHVWAWPHIYLCMGALCVCIFSVFFVFYSFELGFVAIALRMPHIFFPLLAK